MLIFLQTCGRANVFDFCLALDVVWLKRVFRIALQKVQTDFLRRLEPNKAESLCHPVAHSTGELWRRSKETEEMVSSELCCCCWSVVFFFLVRVRADRCISVPGLTVQQTHFGRSMIEMTSRAIERHQTSMLTCAGAEPVVCGRERYG